MIRQPTTESFPKDVEKHQMTVLLDQGVHRHIRFEKPGSSNMWFALTTWPEYLTISGDMGTWSFSHVEDMFDFFRSRPGQFYINPQYWEEKLQVGRYDGRSHARVFDPDKFKSEIFEQLSRHYDLEGDDLERVKLELEDEVFCDDQSETIRAAKEFYLDLDSGERFELDSYELPDGEVYSYHFLWCLYAIVWGIQQWDEKYATIPTASI
jgi:hypothetical protein